MSLVVASGFRTITIRRTCPHCKLAHSLSFPTRHEATAATKSGAEKELDNYFKEFEKSFYTDSTLQDSVGAICTHCWKLAPNAAKRFFPKGLKAALVEDLVQMESGNRSGQSISRVFGAVAAFFAVLAFFLPNYFFDSFTSESERQGIQAMSIFAGVVLAIVAIWMFALSFFFRAKHPKLAATCIRTRQRIGTLDETILLRAVWLAMKETNNYDIRYRGHWDEKLDMACQR